MKQVGNIALSLIALSIVGCGSESDSSSINDNNPSANPNAITVIDGYIENAEVCVSTEVNAPCVFKGDTNELGQLVIPEEFAGLIVTANIIGGKSSDSDTLGSSPKSYSMIGTEGSKVVTPFTTMAATNPNLTIEDIAAKLEVEPEALTGDYIKAGNSKVHLYARTVASQLDEETTAEDTEFLTQVLEKTKAAVENLEGNSGSSVDYNEVVIDIKKDKDGNATAKPAKRIATGSDFFERVDDANEPIAIFMASTNPTRLEDDGVEELKYKDGSGRNQDGSMEFKYKFAKDMMTITSTFGSETDQIIYLSNDFALLVPVDDNDLILHSTEDLNQVVAFTKADVLGKTLYYISDDSNDKNPKPRLSSMAFSDTTVTMTEVDESTGGKSEMNVPYTISDGKINVDFGAIDPDDSPLILSKVAASNDMFITWDDAVQSYSLSVFDEKFAEKLLNDWKSVK